MVELKPPGRVAIVTGASSGIGLATAQALSKAGYQVFGTSRRTAEGPQPGIVMLSCDVSQDASVQKLIEEVQARAGRIDLLVNNAGIGLIGGAEESSVEQAKQLFDVNVFGTIRMCNGVLPIMRRQKSGRIINMSSVLGLIPAPYSALYSSTKHAIEGYSESLDHEVRAFGVRVVLVEPAYTKTSFEANAVEPDHKIDAYTFQREASLKFVREALAVADDPTIVAKTVVHAAKASTPRHRYASGKTAKNVSFLRRFVPEGAFDKSLRKQMKLPV
jgi:NAD(P)-dependent dehydrogenase (short-subunit alcohol dehydrogenase family)